MITLRHTTAARILALGALATLVVGCEAPEMPRSSGPPAKSADADKAEEPKLDPAGASPTTSEPVEFTADSPQKGRRSAAAGGYLGAVGHARFWAEHELIRLNIQKALDLFNAQRGRYPESHEEFMQEIIRYNQIQLPVLPDGEEYIYNTEEHKLMVQLKEQ